MAWIELKQVFDDLEQMGLIKRHSHRKGIVKLVACSRCSYEAYKKSKLAILAIIVEKRERPDSILFGE